LVFPAGFLAGFFAAFLGDFFLAGAFADRFLGFIAVFFVGPRLRPSRASGRGEVLEPRFGLLFPVFAALILAAIGCLG
jgi:hypothetical protein